ncbi:MAG: hypothetical protein P9L94_01265 [Candidatus Hinthialibacter antarcticus]|nr:hypothetical protein [Candidatus Hinthialibacter antarcticus]
MKRSINMNLAYAFPLTVIGMLVVSIIGESYQFAHRVLYPIDDPYIHLAMARHFAEHGVWGVSLSGFSASSSSPGWTLLLAAAFSIIGNHEWLPLALNGAAALTLVWLMCVYLINQQWHWAAAGAAAIVFSLILPLPALILLGMEHTIHVLLAASMAYTASTLLGKERAKTALVLLFLLAFFATAFRYETVFVIAPLALMFFIRKQWRTALGIIICAALPIVMMGAVQVMNGWEFFPASIVRKSVLGQPGWLFFLQLYERLFGQLFNTGHLLIPYVLCLFVFWRKTETPWNSERILSGVYLCATPLHCAAASIGWFYRYEAYLLAIAFLALAPLGPQLWTQWKHLASGSPKRERRMVQTIALATALLAITPYVWNASSVLKIAPGCKNLYQQQYQMGLFLKQYYQGEAVAANDIGAINFLADIRCLDGMGLSSREPSLAAKHGRMGAAFIESWARQEGASIAVIYESWWRGRLPESWIKVGEWTVDQKVSVAEPTVSFYAISPREAERLQKNLMDFTTQLPEGVTANIAVKG